jgi:hypothetical protein
MRAGRRRNPVIAVLTILLVLTTAGGVGAAAFQRPVFGVLAVGFMMVIYALEQRHRVFVLAFAAGCVLSSAYGFLSELGPSEWSSSSGPWLTP